MSWESDWVRCQHPDHWKVAKYDKNGKQKGYRCRSCGYEVCESCGGKAYGRCPKCGAK